MHFKKWNVTLVRILKIKDYNCVNDRFEELYHLKKKLKCRQAENLKE